MYPSGRPEEKFQARLLWTEYREENLGTCILIGPQDVDSPKAIFAANALVERFHATGFPEEITQFRDRLGRDVPYPSIVLNGLDNPDARNEVQGIWPALLLDGAIGDFPCQVSRHRWGDDSACLCCLFRQPQGESAEEVQSRSTGLSMSRVRQFDDLVTEDDVHNATPDKRRVASGKNRASGLFRCPRRGCATVVRREAAGRLPAIRCRCLEYEG